MIMKASHNVFLYPFFRFYSTLRIRAAFREIRIEGEVTDRGLPVLVLANHFSWWDGFWIMQMNEKLFKRKFYFMMLEQQLRRLWVFNKTGGYSVRKGSRSIIESISYTITLLEDSDNMVLIFPQGRIESMHRNDFVFEKGAIRIADQAKKVQILFVVNLVEYFSHSRPTLFMFLAEYNNENPGGIEKAYNEFWHSTMKRHLERKENE